MENLYHYGLRVWGEFVVLLCCVGGELPMAGGSQLPSMGCLVPPENSDQLSEEEKLFLTYTDIHHESHHFEINPRVMNQNNVSSLATS